MNRNLNMTEGRPVRLLLVFALPLMFGNVFQQLYTVVDTAIVGRGVSLDALAAVGAVDWLCWLILGLALGFSQGFAVKMSQDFGADDREGLRRTIGASARLSVIIAVVTVAASEAALPLFLRLLRVRPELAGMSDLYLRILFAGTPIVLFYNFCASVLRAVGNSRTPLIAMIIASVTNIGLDLLTVFVFGWGIAGAAGATLAAQALSGVICAVSIARTPELRFGREHLRRDRALTRRLLALGLPVALQNTVISVGGVVVQTIVNGYDVAFIAGFTATNKLYGLLEIAALSYGYAVTTYVGQNFGARRADRVRAGMRAGVLLSLVTAAVIAGAMILWGRQATMLFLSSEDPAVELAAGRTAYRYLVIMSAALPVLYLLYLYRAALQGMGDTVIPMVSGIVEFVMRVGVAVIVFFTGHRNNIFFSEVTAWIGAALLLGIAYYVSAARLARRPEFRPPAAPGEI